MFDIQIQIHNSCDLSDGIVDLQIPHAVDLNLTVKINFVFPIFGIFMTTNSSRLKWSE